MNPSRSLRIFQVAGDEVTMGRRLGELMCRVGEPGEILGYFRHLPKHILGMGRRDRGRRLIVAGLEHALQPGLARLDRARPESMRARTRAFLAALGRPDSDRLGLVALDAAQNAIGLLSRAGLSGGAKAEALGGLAFPGACSSFAVWGQKSEDGRLLHARNFDLPDPGAWTRSPAVVFCQPRDGLRYGYVTTSGADIPGVTAFNEAGLTVTAHTRFHERVTFDGLAIVDLGHLIVRSARTLAEAVAIAARQTVASSWALVVSSARERRALAIEVHAGRVAVDYGAEEDFFCATNRNQVPVMRPGEVAPSAAWVRYSDGRLAAMKRALEGIGPGRGLDTDAAKTLLGSHVAGELDTGFERATGDCLGQSISIQSVVVDPEREVIHVSAGDVPASRGPWVEVPWRWDEGAAMTELAANEGPSSGGDRYRVGSEGLAYEAFLLASRLEIQRGPEALVRAAMERAVALCPEDPSFRHLAGGLALRDGDLRHAAEHLEVALEHEPSPFRRCELLRWDAKVARWSGQPRRERERRSELLAQLPPALATAAVKDIEHRRRIEPVGVDFQLLAITT